MSKDGLRQLAYDILNDDYGIPLPAFMNLLDLLDTADALELGKHTKIKTVDTNNPITNDRVYLPKNHRLKWYE